MATTDFLLKQSTTNNRHVHTHTKSITIPFRLYRFITFLINQNIKTKVKIVTKKKIFDLDPGKLYFINKRVKLREKKYFLNLRKNNECSK